MATQISSLIKFRCTSCNQLFGIPESNAGRQVKCPKCQQPLRVPIVAPDSRMAAAMGRNSSTPVFFPPLVPTRAQMTAAVETATSSPTRSFALETSLHPLQLRWKGGQWFSQGLDMLRNRRPAAIATVVGSAVILLVLVYTALSEQPSHETIENAVKDYWKEHYRQQRGIPTYGGRFPLQKVEAQVMRIGKFNAQKNYWPVQVSYEYSTAQGAGRGHTYAPFMIYQDDFGKWRAKPLSPNEVR